MAEPSAYPNTTYQRRGDALSWVIPALIIMAAIAVYAYYKNKPQNTTPSPTVSSSATTSEPRSVTSATDLGTAAAGTRAVLSNITISQVVSDRIFAIKSDSQIIYAILSPNLNLPAKTTLQSGQTVAITGTLVSTNSDQFKNLNLAAAEKAALANQSLVLLVDQVTISGSNATTNPSTK